MIGGTDAAVAVVSSPKFMQSMRVRHRFIAPLTEILGHLEGSAELFETSTSHILRDPTIMFGFDKTGASFPSIKLLEPQSGRDRITFVRTEVVFAMNALCAALDEGGPQA